MKPWVMQSFLTFDLMYRTLKCDHSLENKHLKTSSIMNEVCGSLFFVLCMVGSLCKNKGFVYFRQDHHTINFTLELLTSYWFISSFVMVIGLSGIQFRESGE